MKVLDNIKRTLESIEAKKAPEVIAEEDKFAALYEKYNDIPAEALAAIIADVEAICNPVEAPAEEPEMVENEIEDIEAPAEELAPAEDEVVEENDELKDEIIIDENNETDVIEVKEPEAVEHTDATKAESEDFDETPEDFYTEEDDDVDDEIIISEEDEEVEEEEDFDVYADELDVVEEDEEEIDMTISSDDVDEKPENAEKIDMDIPEEDNGVEVADAAEKEPVNEDNMGAKAAIANRQNKGNFSSDVDALTEYLDEY